MSTPSRNASQTFAAAQLAFQFQQATALHGAGRVLEAKALYEDILKKRPRHADALHHLGVLAYQAGDMRRAADLIAKAIRSGPATTAMYSNQGLALQGLGQPQDAVISYDKAIAGTPNFAGAHSNRGSALYELGQFDAALAACDRAIALNSRDPGALYNRGMVLQALARIDEALASYAQALALQPDHAAAHINRGNTLQDLGRLDEAVAAYGHAIALDDRLAPAFANRGAAFQKLERIDEALADYTRATALDPADFEAKKNFFWVHLWYFKDAALIERLSTELAQMTADIDVGRLKARKAVADFRLLHDLEQAAYLVAQGTKFEGLAEAHDRMRAIYARTAHAQGGKEAAKLITLSGKEVEALARYRKTVVRLAIEPVKAALNPGNAWAEIEEQYFAGTPEIVVIDNLLTPEALASLRAFCLASTVWRTDYDNQYLGAFPEDGFVSPLHFQIATELRQVMPRIFGDHALEQLWAFKYTSRLGKGINAHADFARVNLNFWITPDAANLDPNTGGMVIYDVPAPRDWAFYDYNFDQEKIYAFLEENKSGSRRVPYRCNRAVLFNSTLFHKTADIVFKDGYENRRINVTYLFGLGLKFPRQNT